MALVRAQDRDGDGAATVPPRVIYAMVLTPGMKFGSVEEQITLMAQAFEASGSFFLPVFATSDKNASLEDFQARGVEAACIDLKQFSLAGLRELCLMIDEHNIEAVHWNLFHALANPYVWFLSVLRPWVKHLYSDHVSRWDYSVRVYSSLAYCARKLLWRRYSGVHCISDFVRDELVGRTGVANAVTVRHFMNTSRFLADPVRRERTRARLGFSDEFLILFVGFLIRDKGADVVLRALAALPPRAKLLIAGDGPEEAALRLSAEQLGIADRVTFLGLVRETVPYFQAADVLVCPSLWQEAAGLVNLEAQAAGLPVIASRIGGIPEYVIDGATGLLFTPGDADELAACLSSLIADPALKSRLSRQATAHAQAEFSPERGQREMLEWYRGVVGRSTRSSRAFLRADRPLTRSH